MLTIQILIIAFVAFAIVRTFAQYRQGRIPTPWFLFWVVFWVMVAIVASLPQVTDVAARFVGIGRGADFVIYVSLIALFYLIFRLFIKIEEIERQITKLVRKLAIDEKEKQD